METMGKMRLSSIVMALGVSLIRAVGSSCHSRLKRAFSTMAMMTIPTMSQSSIRMPLAIRSRARIPKTVNDRWNSVISLGTFIVQYVFSAKTRAGWA